MTILRCIFCESARNLTTRTIDETVTAVCKSCANANSTLCDALANTGDRCRVKTLNSNGRCEGHKDYPSLNWKKCPNCDIRWVPVNDESFKCKVCETQKRLKGYW